MRTSVRPITDRAFQTNRAESFWSRPMLWLAICASALLAHFLITEPATFPSWDEAVFYSQSGGIPGVDSDPSSYAASREPGTPALIGGLRALGLNLEAIRLSFMFIYVSLVSLGFFLLSPFLKAGAVAGAVVMLGHWIPLSYSPRFYGVPIAAALFVVAAAFGIRLLVEPINKRAWWWAGGLAAAVAGMLAMRHLEAPIAAVALFATLVFSAIRRREKVGRVLTAGLVALLLFGAVEIGRATFYHGSVSEWIEALMTQLGGVGANEDDGLSRLVEIGQSLIGDQHMWLSEPLPGPVFPIFIAAGLVILVLIHRMKTRIDLDETQRVGWRPTGLSASIAILVLAGYFGLFVLGRYPVSPKDRYLMWFVAGGAILLAVVLRGRFSRSQSAGLVLASALWLVPNVTAASYDASFFLENGEGLRQYGMAMHVLADGEPCEAAARYSSPSLALASGCSIVTISSTDAAITWLEEAPADGVRFLVYPPVAEVVETPEWTVTSREGSRVSLWYRNE